MSMKLRRREWSRKYRETEGASAEISAASGRRSAGFSVASSSASAKVKRFAAR